MWKKKKKKKTRDGGGWIRLSDDAVKKLREKRKREMVGKSSYRHWSDFRWRRKSSSKTVTPRTLGVRLVESCHGICIKCRLENNHPYRKYI